MKIIFDCMLSLFVSDEGVIPKQGKSTLRSTRNCDAAAVVLVFMLQRAARRVFLQKILEE
jgi:hypothetical protein